jgi:hypothetical protein
MELNKTSRKIIISGLILFIIGVFFWIQRGRFFGLNNKRAQNEAGIEKSKVVTMAGPPTVIYKTKADYVNLVPVGMSEDRKSIVSYPNMTDMLPNNYPIKLSAGYYFGSVSVNSGFLKLTMEEYAALNELPSPEKLYDMLTDKDPFLEMYACGSRYEFKEIEKELNQIIDSGKLTSRCDKIK